MKLESFLHKFGKSRAEFAKEIGVSQPTLHRYLRDSRYPRKEIMARIYRATDGLVGPADFIDLSLAPHSAPAVELTG
jgi:transcriptional regulator with XRE-family HTH domain